MSYSFQAKGATASEALTDFDKKYDEVVSYQVEHETDRAAAKIAAESLLNVCTFPDDQDVVIYACGSINWTNTSSGKQFTNANVQVSVGSARRAA